MRVLLLAVPHSINAELIKIPPENVVYVHSNFRDTTKDFLIKKLTKRFFWNIYMQIMPISFYINTDCDLIHSSNALIINKKPWVVDVETLSALVEHKMNRLKNKYLKTIEKYFSSEYCKKIIPMSNASKKTIDYFFDSNKIRDKIQIVYPAVKSIKLSKIKKDEDRIKLLFIARYRYFFEKGGKQILDAFDVLNKKYDIDLTIVANVPEEIKNKYKINNIHFFSPQFTREQLYKKFYPYADIYVYPTFTDAFGMSLIEAMNFKLPIVTTDIFAIPEIVEDGKNGFVIKSKMNFYMKNRILHRWEYCSHEWFAFENYIKNNRLKIVDDLVEKLSILIENKRLREKFGKNGKEEIDKGKFSIKVRNKNLKQIYEESLK